MGRLEGKVALITGGGSGIGAASALRFAEEGAAVVALDLRARSGGDWDAATRRARDAELIVADVTDGNAVDAAVARVVDRFGRLDILVNAAGVAGGGPVHLMPTEEWNRVISVNLNGTFIPIRAALGPMLEQRSGSIINIASIEGIEGVEGGSSYNASKGGVVILTKNLAMDYGRRGIRVNAICPGFIETPMREQVFAMEGVQEVRANIERHSQLGRFGRPVEVANAALFLASDEASYVSGHALVVDGGFIAGHRAGIARMMGLED